MDVQTYKSVQAYLAQVQPLLEAREVEHCLMQGIALNIRRSPALEKNAYFITVADQGAVVASALVTPPFNVLLGVYQPDVDAALELLVARVVEEQWPVPGVLGDVEESLFFAETYQRLTGRTYSKNMSERLFMLTEVAFPRPAPGRLRMATKKDFKQLLEWNRAFFAEALPDMPPEDDSKQMISRITHGDYWIWETPEQEPVSMAATSRALSTTISIGLVYTPPALRGRGYAANCVATLSQHLLEQGWQSCNLFTNLANPISNAIYQKIGYRAVKDFQIYRIA
ncbi:GNAT family N-acetyltransferase [Tengunoibacter tsumagoiensis]|uniref:N-acetyltransferase n=1 Tax=Tengunoibacter tsumagoiensis TaxID=2014871 RepID=A0A401ZUC4_9CHLR|nr:GNAT family N-acetyltransferase [Tengunoibacter tsumagoiensis]GCE10402.1 N-acetyltransferase [Tengunoibacter tsumagoiensis]